MNALAGTLGNGAAGFTTSALSNINPYQDGGAQSWSKGVGFDTLVGAILGGASAGLAEGVTSKLSIKSLGTEEFSKGTHRIAATQICTRDCGPRRDRDGRYGVIAYRGDVRL